MRGARPKFAILAIALMVYASVPLSLTAGPNQPQALRGVIDLRAWDFETDGAIALSGEWSFSWMRFLDPTAAGSDPDEPDAYVEVPGSWAGTEIANEAIGPDGAATYRLTVLLPPNPPPLMLYQRQIDTSSEIYANGQLIAANGSPGIGSEETRARVAVRPLLLPPSPDGQLRLTYHAANFDNDIGGLWERIDLGTAGQIISEREWNLFKEFFLFGAFILAAIYHVGLFASRRKDLPALLFGLFCLIMAFRIPFTAETTIHMFVSDISYRAYKQWDHSLIYLAAPIFTAFAATLFARGRARRAPIMYSLVSLPFLLCVLILPTRAFVELLGYYELLLIINIVWLLGLLIVATFRKREGAAVSLAGLGFLFATIINDILASHVIIKAPYVMPIGMFVFIFSQAYMLSRLFARAYNTAESLSLELKTKNNELTRLDQLKDEFLANTSHELRTPLNGIIGIADSLIAGIAGNLNATMRANLALISAGGRRLSGLVNDLLDFSKLRNRDIELRLRTVDISSAVDVALALTGPLVGEKKLRLINQCPDLLVEADEDRLDQILLNLIGNAIKFTEHGEIVVNARRLDSEGGHMIAVTVEDTGIGIPAGRLEAVFESFVQADGSISREYGGTGLGLSITRSLVELHGGHIRAERRDEGGSRLTFTLPAAALDAVAPGESAGIGRALPDAQVPSTDGPAEREPAETGAPEEGAIRDVPSVAGLSRILIVDDDPVNLQVLQNHLQLARYSVVECHTGQEALALIEQGERFDLILLDVMMPRLSGYEVCRLVRDSFSRTELPVIMLTAKNRISDLIAGLEHGANDYLVKPFDSRELLARVGTLLDLKRAAQSQSQLAALESELDIARLIQESLIPREVPRVPGLTLAARYRTMERVGGDFYDFAPLDDHRLGVLVADVSGHGVPAALIVSMLKVAFWFYQTDFTQPERLFRRLNESLLGNTRNEFVTACYVFVDAKNRTLTIASGGHPPVYLWKGSSGELRALRPEGRLLAFFEDGMFGQQTVSLDPGDRLVLYTDGFLEAGSRSTGIFGEARFEDCIRQGANLKAESLADLLIESVAEWSGGADLIGDDVALVVIDIDS